MAHSRSGTIMVLAASLVIGATGASLGKELRVGSGGPPVHPSYNPMYTTFMAKLREVSGGDLTARHLGLEVNDLRGAMSNLQSGVLDIANVLALYFPEEFPNFMLISELATLGKSGQSMSGAVSEYIVTCEDCQKEFAKKGLVYLGTGSTTSYAVLTTMPVRALADIKGKRLRSGGAPFTRWAQVLGAIPSAISFNEEYEAIANGLLDGSIAPPINLMTGKLYEKAKYVTPLDIGTFHSSAGFTTRQKTWQELTLKQREAVMTAAVAGVSASVPGFNKGVELAKKNGAIFVKPDKDLVDAHQAFEAKDMATVVELGKTRYRIADSQAKVERFYALVRKWRGIADKFGEDNTEAMAKALYDEVFSKLDLTRYGL